LYSIFTGNDSWCNITTYSDAEVKMAIAEKVLKGKYPAKAHAKKVAQWILEKGGDANGTIYLEAQKQRLNEVGICFIDCW
jgi:imidazolonepropionase-like amidohydrolase